MKNFITKKLKQIMVSLVENLVDSICWIFQNALLWIILIFTIQIINIETVEKYKNYKLKRCDAQNKILLRELHKK